MTVKYNIIGYLIGEGFSNVLKNKKSTGAALTIMCMAMFMFGIFFVLGENINYVMSQIQTEQGMQVFLERGTTDLEISEIETKIRAIEGVNTVKFISSSEGVNEMKEQVKDYVELLDGLEDYIQASFIVTLTELELNQSVQNSINAIDKVDTITGSDKTIDMLVNITKGIRMVTFAILIILVFISVFIITNTIKLTVHARRKEISIMKYVGATNGFIRWPFIIEGIIIGLVSALITVLIVGLLYNTATNELVQTDTFQKLELKLYTFADMFELLILTYIGLGVGIGVVGSSISMRKYLEV